MKQLHLIHKILPWALAATLLGCAEGNPTIEGATTKCQSGVAQVQVEDGFFRILCGCAETAGTQAISGLTCTVSLGTKVFFHYSGTLLPHQLTSSNPDFGTSPISEPGRMNTARTHVVHPTAVGDYAFHDLFNAQMTGILRVQ